MVTCAVRALKHTLPMNSTDLSVPFKVNLCSAFNEITNVERGSVCL